MRGSRCATDTIGTSASPPARARSTASRFIRRITEIPPTSRGRGCSWSGPETRAATSRWRRHDTSAPPSSPCAAALSSARGYHCLPKTYLGMPAAELDRPWLPLWAQRTFLGGMVRVIHGSNGRYGIPDPDHRLFDRHPVVNSEMLHALRHGRVEYRPDIARFDGRTVSFVDGRREEVDTIVCSTGFAVSFPFLDRDLF